jgi:hypothetical protein
VSFGIILTLWTARLAMMYYGLAAGAWILRRIEVARWAWIAGAFFFAVHTVSAFQFVFHWSHSEAWMETARRSNAMSGFDSGFGLWLNYLFAMLWLGDAGLLWLAPLRHARLPRWFGLSMHGFLLFMVVNGAIVFAHGPMRVASIAALGGLILLALFRGLPKPVQS